MSDWRGLYQNVEQPWEPTKAPAMQNPVQGIRAIDPRTVGANASAYGQAMTARVGQAAAQKDLYAYIARVRQTQKDFLPEAGDDPDKLMAAAVAREVKVRAAARDTMDRSSGFVAGVVGFAGSASKAVEDPVVIGTLPFGGGGRTLFGIAAREFAVNALTTAVSQPIAAQNRAVVGEDLSLGEAATNIVTAGVAGAAIGGGVHLLGSGVGKLGAAWDGTMGRVYEALPTHLQEKWAGASVLPDEALPEIASAVIGADRFTPDMQAAMHVINRHAEVEAVSPFAAGSRNVETHDDRLADVLRSIAEANPMPSYRAQLSGGTTLGRGVVPDAAIGRSSAPAPEMAGYMRAVRGAESSGDDSAAAATSSAYGRYQFTRGTWLRMIIAKQGRQGRTDAQLLALRSNGALQDVMMRDLTVANAAALRRRGHEPTSANLYLSHFAGPADAARILDAADDVPLTAVMRAESLAANPHLKGKTAGDLRAWAVRKVGGDAPAPVVRAIEDGADDAARMADLDAESARLNSEALALASPPATFETAKGSIYRVEADGTTTRDKAFRPEHGEAEQGLMPTSAATYYVSADDALKLAEFQAEGQGKVAIAAMSDGRIGLQYLDGKDAGKFERRTVVTPQSSPAVGLTPVETWRDGTRVHFGNEIVRVSAETSPPSSASSPLKIPVEAVEDQARLAPVDDYDAVAPMLATEGDVAPAARFDADDPVWDAIDRHEADLSMDAIGSVDPTPDPALMAFDDPRGQGAQTQIDSMFHDLRLTAERDPKAMIRLTDEGDEQLLVDVLQDLDDDKAAIAAVQGCL